MAYTSNQPYYLIITHQVVLMVTQKVALIKVERSVIIIKAQRMRDKASSKKNLRTCHNGHAYYKSSDCPVCPICESMKNPDEEFLSVVSAPARRALGNAGIKSLVKLSEFTTTQLLKLHGMGPSSIPKLRKVLKESGLVFKDEMIR